MEQFLESKYGKKITRRLVKDSSLDTGSIKYKNGGDQSLVKKHLYELKNKLNLDIDIAKFNWAFDFSGWLGRLSFTEPHVRKYMVIGLEPHIEDYDFQITYGLSERTPLEHIQRFSIDTSEADFVRCRNDCNLIWTNLFKLFASEAITNSVFNEKDEWALIEFLNQFYITDLCHFVPQGKANAINDVKNWKKTRSIVANHFLSKK